MWPLCRSTFLHLQLSNSCPTSIRSKVFLAPGGNNAFNPTLNWCKIFKKSEMMEVFFSSPQRRLYFNLLLQCYKMPSKVRIGIKGSISCSFISGNLQSYLSGQIWDMRLGVGCFVAISWTTMYFGGMGWDREEKLSAQNLQLDAYFVENRFTGQSPP